MSQRSWSAAAITVTASLVLAACGAAGTSGSGTSPSAGPSKSASTGPNVAALTGRAVAGMKQARDVKVTGTAFSGSQKVAMDIVLTRSGMLGGKIAISGHWVRLRTSKRHVYVLVTRSMAAWQKFPAGACALMCGKWLQESAAELGSVATDVSWAKVVGAFEKPISAESASYQGTATVAGQPALKLTFLGDGTIYVAAHGTPYPLRITAAGDQFTFSDWNTAKLPPLPPASKVVTVGELKSMAAGA